MSSRTAWRLIQDVPSGLARAESLDRSVGYPDAWLRTARSHSRSEKGGSMIVGIDSHKDTIAACAVDQLGRETAAGIFANTEDGHGRLLA